MVAIALTAAVGEALATARALQLARRDQTFPRSLASEFAG
jgi:hypothetical protein